MCRRLGLLAALGVCLTQGRPAEASGATDRDPRPDPTVVVFPLKVEGALSDLGFALSLRVLGVLRAAGGTNLVHPKMLARVAAKYEPHVAKLPPTQARARLGGVLGADLVLHGRLDERRDQLVLSLAEVPSGEVVATHEFRPRKLRNVLEGLPGAVMATFRKAGYLTEVPTPDLIEVAPSTRYRQAMLDHAACHRGLIQQPLGISRPIVVDESAVRLAMDFCQEALRRDPGFESARADLALAHAFLGEQRQAERMLISLRDSRSVLPMYWLARFWVLSRFYDPDLGVENLREAIRTHPGFMLGRGYLGEALLALGRSEEAIEVFQDYLDRCPRQSYVMAQIGAAASRDGSPQLGIEWTERALRVTPDDPELLARLGSRWMDAGRPQAAVEILARVIERGGARGGVHLALGRAHMALGHRTASVRQIRQAIAKSPGPSGWRTRGEARYALAEMWTGEGSPENAIRQLRQALLEGYLDVGAIQSDTLAPLRSHRDYRRLRRTEPRPGAAPRYVSPLGRVTTSARLKLRTRFEVYSDRRVLNRL